MSKIKNIKHLFQIINEEIKNFIDEFDVSNLKDISLKTNAPQVSRGRFKADIVDDKITVFSDDFKPNTKYDYVVDVNGDILIGDGHYKLASKADNVKAAGEIMIDNNGKVIYLNNESGHYEPSKEDLQAIADKFKELKIASPDLVVDKRY